MSGEVSARVSSVAELSARLLCAEADLSGEVSARISSDEQLMSEILSNRSEISDLWKNIRGGLNYIGNINVSSDYSTVYLAIADNFRPDPPQLLREGFFFLV